MYKFTKEHRRKISEGVKGLPAWNKGLTKDNHSGIASMAEKKKKSGAIKGNEREYNSWIHMNARCKKGHYFNLGIKVCNRWSSDLPNHEGFKNFLLDLGKRPENKTLDRIDNDGNYEPSNCRWATVSEQNANKKHKMTG